MRTAVTGALTGVVMSVLAGLQGHAATLEWQTLTGEAPQVVGHRGAPSYLPENSLPGYELAAQLGAARVETDVQITKDGELIIMHDGSLQRTTDIATKFLPRNGGYDVSEFTLAEIKELSLLATGVQEYTYPGFTPTTDYTVPTLGEFLETMNSANATNGTNTGVLVELKSSYTPEVNAKVVQEMIDHGFAEDGSNGAVQSFSVENTKEMSRLLDEAGKDIFVDLLGYGGVLTDDGWALGLNGAGTRYELLSDIVSYADAVASSYTYITEDFVDAVHAAGLEIYAWTLRPGDEADASAMIADFLAWGVDGFITDNTDIVLSALDASGYSTALPAVPVPATLPLLLGGIGVFAGLARRKRSLNA